MASPFPRCRVGFACFVVGFLLAASALVAFDLRHAGLALALFLLGMAHNLVGAWLRADDRFPMAVGVVVWVLIALQHVLAVR